MLGKVSVVVLLALSAGSLAAQGGGGRRALQGQRPPMGDSGGAPNRAQLEQRVRQRLGQMMKQQLGLSDAQMTKLQETNRKFDEKRRVLVDQERDIRMSLRDEVIRPDSGRQAQVGSLLDRMTKVQRQRVDLMEAEQKELSAFLTPLQRVQYMGAEEKVRQRMQEMRQQRLNGRGRPMGPDDQGGPPMGQGMGQGMGRGRMGQGPPPGGMDPQMGPNRLRKRPPPVIPPDSEPPMPEVP